MSFRLLLDLHWCYNVSMLNNNSSIYRNTVADLIKSGCLVLPVYCVFFFNLLYFYSIQRKKHLLNLGMGVTL